MVLFAGISVSDFARGKPWYEQLLGRPPTFAPHDRECVWELTDRGSVYINEDAGRAGHATVLLLVDDLDQTLRDIRDRGLEAAREETYSNGVRKAVFQDADGNEFGFAAEG